MEEKKVPEEQIEFLRKKLTGNEAFGRVRGQLTEKQSLLESVLEEAESPTDFCRRWDQLSSDMRIFGNQLAQFKRDGWDTAYEELTRALKDKTYRLPGETVPLHQTEPITIVMFDFPRTLTLIRWIRCAHWMDLDNYLEELNQSWTDGLSKKYWFSSGNPSRTLTHELFKAFPSLKEYTLTRRQYREYEGWELVKSYYEHVLGKFDHAKLRDIGQPLTLARDTYNDHLELYRGVGERMCLGYICRADQAEVLSRFSREEQKQIATWTIRMPKVNAENDFRGMFIGFHPEEGHDEWEAESSNLVSIGCHQDYGVVAMSRPYSDPLRDHTGRYHEQYSISQVYLKDLDEQLAFELDVA
ncbi:hypothetical protein GWN26_14200 [Candidatus Saccharibacteria bacterium]|nr:hypothetical protein [Candidatus Saccharibacteria bacterium]NIV04407.1 hypothetical protein [Calditrichia bacterium]NIV72956.1 hypothetical protein [Calditrichia bacterium]NIW00199.1 hypothetical protein [Candidatus Saccharibacteria bacterium]NIW80550.1 hypothetical protein [Calditrichia bacterium]